MERTRPGGADTWISSCRSASGSHAAMNYAELPAFISDLHARQAIAALALEFAILTAARSGEVLGARWEEFDIERGVWTVPAARMKAGREHRVPLSRRQNPKGEW